MGGESGGWLGGLRVFDVLSGSQMVDNLVDVVVAFSRCSRTREKRSRGVSGAFYGCPGCGG